MIAYPLDPWSLSTAGVALAWGAVVVYQALSK